MNDVQKLLNTTKPFLTDGGLETWLFFVEGFEAPEFAAILLMDDDVARRKMQAYFYRFLAMAEQAETGFVLDTNTWRGCVGWAPKLGISAEKLLDLSRDAVRFAQETRSAWASRVSPVLVNGVVGPAGDGYAADADMAVGTAEELHAPQIETLADAGVDMVSAITMTNSAEAIGIAHAVAKVELPSVISFTVETDGRLPTGESLADAIARTDDATAAAPIYYMINCAHPEHFRDTLDTRDGWVTRIGGVRANASRMSHEELDNSETLDDGDPEEFGLLHAALRPSLPALRVVGGCCGTDHRHVGCVSDHLHKKSAA